VRTNEDCHMSSSSQASANPFDRLIKALMSTLSLKIVMALTGLGGALFVLVHMAGNLQMFLGRDAYNEYAAFMQGLGAAKWAARLGLITILVAHVGAAVLLVRRNQKARPDHYAELRPRATSLAALYMAELGFVLLFFIIYHIAHFTLGAVHTDFGGVDYMALQQATEDGGTRRDLYAHVVMSFQQPLIASLYILSSIALAMHLSHGATSMFKSVGFGIGRWKVPFEVVGPAFGVIVGLGNISMPLAVWAGFIGGN
jgi:succinate dehydrogenase / fumarate reductase cytochrome b subunit